MNNSGPYLNFLDGYNFATRVDRENALWAALLVTQAVIKSSHCEGFFRPPLIAILGAPQTGRSHFAQRLSELAGVSAVMANMSDRTFDYVAASKTPVVRFDDVAFRRNPTNALCSFVTSAERMIRPHGQKEHVTCALNCVTIITTTGPVLPPDVEKRALVIRLLKPEWMQMKSTGYRPGIRKNALISRDAAERSSPATQRVRRPKPAGSHVSVSRQNPIYGRRAAFVAKYCALKGWDRENLSNRKIAEIRSQADWINPPVPAPLTGRVIFAGGRVDAIKTEPGARRRMVKPVATKSKRKPVKRKAA